MIIAPGSTVDQKYWVERVVGRGGMGVVVAATHLQLGQRVALKFLHGDAKYDPSAVARFLREARSAVRLRSEHVGRVIDVGTLDDGAPYIVMEYLEGEDLGALLARRGPLPVATAVDLVLQACLALAEAHAARIVHRDLKPSNLFLTRRPDGSALLKVLDFGIAKAHGTLNAELTASSAIVGSPPYMSPEQLRSSRDVDARSDLWSLGVVLYELVSGRRPYVADSLTAMAVRIATEDPPPLPPGIPRGFAEVVGRCLQREPGRRYADVAALARALAAWGGPGATDVAASIARVQTGGRRAPRRPDALRALMEAATVSQGEASTASGVSTLPYLPRRSAFWIGIAAGVAAVALAVVVIVAVRRSPSAGVDGGQASDAAAARVGDVDAAQAVVVPAPDAAPAAAPPVATDAAPAVRIDAGVPVDAASAAVVDRGGPRGRPAVDARPASGGPVDAGVRAGGRGVDACVPGPDDENCDGIPDRR